MGRFHFLPIDGFLRFDSTSSIVGPQETVLVQRTVHTHTHTDVGALTDAQTGAEKRGDGRLVVRRARD